MTEYEHREIGLGYKITRNGGASIFDALTAKVVEPHKRNKDGWRFVSHRFPIKNGISRIEAMNLDLIESLYAPSPLFAMFEAKAKNAENGA